ncbi:hypothetical protein QQG55_18825 [Brugia pahangi]|uniref:Uncharacterized protein n=1 Tax=Brugia pahangi TaxID=6280 RepID=A0A0N4TY40_BRUPA|nr:unnamed protein product [Brugia pahangi]
MPHFIYPGDPQTDRSDPMNSWKRHITWRLFFGNALKFPYKSSQSWYRSHLVTKCFFTFFRFLIGPELPGNSSRSGSCIVCDMLSGWLLLTSQTRCSDCTCATPEISHAKLLLMPNCSYSG